MAMAKGNNGVAAAVAVAVAIPVREEKLKIEVEKFESDISKKKNKMHRFPPSMRSLADDSRYAVPNLVAIGPYHRHHKHLREAEEVKRVAAHYFCTDSRNSVDAVYQKIVSVAADARSCYADDDDAVVKGISDEEFKAMMFYDGCFLMQWMRWYTGGDGEKKNTAQPQPLESWFSSMASIQRDVFLLENQIPWLVLEALMKLSTVSVDKFIAKIGATFYINLDLHGEPIFHLEKDITWPHLLGLLRCCVSGTVTEKEINKLPEGASSFALDSSAIEMGEIGIKLEASKTMELKDMGIKKCIFGAQLFLVPFLMDNTGTCWLVNMAALEECISEAWDAKCTIVSSYIAVLAMLMNREEDVHELRAKGLVCGKFSDRETLEFFKTLVKHVCLGPHYVRILAEIDAYKRNRWPLIAVHKFFHNNLKNIITVFTVVGVLVGVFKALLSIKQHRP
ncbi:hypothetical protein GUJ93_ZPchr0008g13354 [Zizania palustris]|uniref:Uncharacterized protein n=1 Tax=Zizania palustris TaxID=103762 RepID=A0A8J5RBE8_ZIZPA|nr:hypothetical protein GUJ93_ZPchr0008g13354 [Zizania palustris]